MSLPNLQTESRQGLVEFLGGVNFGLSYISGLVTPLHTAQMRILSPGHIDPIASYHVRISMCGHLHFKMHKKLPRKYVLALQLPGSSLLCLFFFLSFPYRITFPESPFIPLTW
jgi:hypothetical protein